MSSLDTTLGHAVSWDPLTCMSTPPMTTCSRRFMPAPRALNCSSAWMASSLFKKGARRTELVCWRNKAAAGNTAVELCVHGVRAAHEEQSLHQEFSAYMFEREGPMHSSISVLERWRHHRGLQGCECTCSPGTDGQGITSSEPAPRQTRRTGPWRAYAGWAVQMLLSCHFLSAPSLLHLCPPGFRAHSPAARAWAVSCPASGTRRPASP